MDSVTPLWFGHLRLVQESHPNERPAITLKTHSLQRQSDRGNLLLHSLNGPPHPQVRAADTRRSKRFSHCRARSTQCGNTKDNTAGSKIGKSHFKQEPRLLGSISSSHNVGASGHTDGRSRAPAKRAENYKSQKAAQEQR